METTRAQIYKEIPIPTVERFLSHLKGASLDWQTIIATAEKKFVGKEFNGCTTATHIGWLINRLFAYSPRYSKYAKCIAGWKTEPQTFELRYRDHLFAIISIKKKIGAKHRSWRYGCHDWRVSKIVASYIWEEGLSFEERFAKIDAEIFEAERKKAERKEELYQIWKKICALYPGYSVFQIRAEVKEIDKLSWELSERLKKEKGEI